MRSHVKKIRKIDFFLSHLMLKVSIVLHCITEKKISNNDPSSNGFTKFVKIVKMKLYYRKKKICLKLKGFIHT
ncbi:hypothetical protein RIR_jg1858.t1 [Rhizophagus irregularis DAOM 181602=DAOM 197198]|uniref:Uncharacterized protein n=1 Tax=Rhizophagus irregularis (strain DAOM 181602 / DAOM 197198 / MUCL 43194) TaxID=747089 RepID=U9UZ39_RHIID|nr:hypothetical protein RIR_jg1858.t1 [Rhizophagus irregularis DAOM 181602=DAOM 197198]